MTHAQPPVGDRQDTDIQKPSDKWRPAEGAGLGASIQLQVRDSVGIVRISRPEVLNALDPASTAALAVTVARASSDPSVRAIILTGGEDAFCAGDDLRELARADSTAFEAQILDFQRVARSIRSAPQPVIAAIGGVAAGGGLEIAVDCDLRVATPNARFSCPESRWGLTITNGASVLLRELIGDGWAREMALLGETFDAEKALRIGLITRIVESGRLEEEAVNLARRFASIPSIGLHHTKALLNADPQPLPGTLELETRSIISAFNEGSAHRQVMEFLARRPVRSQR